MKLSEDILNELKTISKVVSDVPYLNVFTVNADYFSGINDELKARITADALYGSQNNFAVPTGYFETLSFNILQRIKEEENEVFTETKEHSALIASIGNKNIYTAPKHYFEELSFTTEEKPVAKVIKMSSARGVFKYAVAAVVTGLIGIGIINIQDRSDEKLPDEVSIQTAATISSANDILKTGTFDKELETVSDNDIVKYLQQGGQDVNAALVAASTDDVSTLPEPAEYLLDENALDNYLKEKNLN
ncbi:MAG: hypothetical protein LH615_07100 [Ferruginibacter sp.]|nr:hypothetical protein [Ferruginibacter sp.]